MTDWFITFWMKAVEGESGITVFIQATLHVLLSKNHLSGAGFKVLPQELQTTFII